jgi:hypothetical protein
MSIRSPKEALSAAAKHEYFIIQIENFILFLSFKHEC